MQLIVPVGGLSTRYGLGRPKWMLTHPDGRTMLEASLEGFLSDDIETINVIITDEVLKEFNLPEDIVERILGYDKRLRVIKLPGASPSQLQTVFRGVTQGGVTGPIVVKDCDNSFKMRQRPLDLGNAVALVKVGQDDDIRRLGAKGFAVVNENTQPDPTVACLVEKRVASPYVCAGAYFFSSAAELVANVATMAGAGYMSEAINKMGRRDRRFRAAEVTDYEDWGTGQEWAEYCGKFRNLLVDIDGVLFENGSRVTEPRWGLGQRPITANLEALRGLMAKGKTRLYLMTARPEAYRDVTERQLREAGLSWSALIMGLYHARRVVINDFSSGPGSHWPTAEALNVIRNSADLGAILNYWPK
jgi:hypothetical protein